MNVLMIVAYVAAAHAFWVPASAWVAADREKYVWAVLLLVPGINILVLVAYTIGVLPLLLPQHMTSRTNPLRRNGPGGHTAAAKYQPR